MQGKASKFDIILEAVAKDMILSVADYFELYILGFYINLLKSNESKKILIFCLI